MKRHMLMTIAGTTVLAVWPLVLAMEAASASTNDIVHVTDQGTAKTRKHRDKKPDQRPLEGARKPKSDTPPDADGSDQDDDAAPSPDVIPGCIFHKAPLELLV